MIGINIRRAPEEADRRFEIVDPHCRRPRLDQRVEIARGLGERHQRAVETLDFLAWEGLHDLARDHLLRGSRGCGQQRGERNR